MSFCNIELSLRHCCSIGGFVFALLFDSVQFSFQVVLIVKWLVRLLGLLSLFAQKIVQQCVYVSLGYLISNRLVAVLRDWKQKSAMSRLLSSLEEHHFY